MPVEGALLPEIDVSHQQDGHIKHHFYEAEPACFHVASQIFEYIRPRIKKNRLHIEQNEDHRHQVELYRKGLAGIPCGRYAAFVWLSLRLVRAAPADKGG